MKRENQRIAVSKRMLKESMLQLLKEKELDKISVTELCRDAGINRATFYRHYQIPRDVLIEIEKDLYYDLKQQIPLPKKPEDVRPTIEKLCRYMEEHIELLRVIIRSNSDTDFALFINSIFSELWHEVRNIGAMKTLSEEDAQLLALYSAGGSYFVLRHWLLGKIHKSSKQMADYVYTLANKTDWGMLYSQLGLLPEK